MESGLLKRRAIVALLGIVLVGGQFLVWAMPLTSVQSARSAILAPVLLCIFLSWEWLRNIRLSRRWLLALYVSFGWVFIAAFLGKANYAAGLTRASEIVIISFFAMSLFSLLQARVVSPRILLFVMALAFIPVLANIITIWFEENIPVTYNWVWKVYPFLNIRHIGFVLVPSFIGVAYFLLGEEKGRVWWGVAFLLLALSFWAGGRGHNVAMLLVVLSWALFVPRTRKRVLVMAFLVAPLATIVSAVFSVQNSELGLWGSGGSIQSLGGGGDASSGRLGVWGEVVGNCLRELPFCYGPDGYRFVSSLRLETAHPHNFVIQVLSEWGLYSLVLLALMAFVAWKVVVRFFGVTRGTADPVAVAVLSGWGVFMIFGLVDGVLYHTYPLVIFAVLTALMAFVMVDGHSMMAKEGVKDGGESGSSFHVASWFFLGVSFVIWCANTNTVLADRPVKGGPDPSGWAATSVRLFPSSIFAVDSWVGEWAKTRPELAHEWNGWMLEVAGRPWPSLLRRGSWHESKGEYGKALEYFRRAEPLMPSAHHLRNGPLQKKIDEVEEKMSEQAK